LFVDHYEVLQISPNADQETIHRVYRIQAARFHPDNLQAGDAEAFRLISDAYQQLSDLRRRADYDVDYRNAQRRQARHQLDQATSPQGIDSERRKRRDVLFLLYRKRLEHPEKPSISLLEFEELMSTPRAQLDFCLCFLKEAGYLVRTDSARHTITMKGAEWVESAIEDPTADLPRITDGSRVA